MIAGLCLSLIFAGIIGMAAWDHKPQNEFTDDPWSLVLICLVGANFVMLPFSVVAVIIEVYVRHKIRPVYKRSVAYYTLLTGLILGLCMAGLFMLSLRDGAGVSLLYGGIACVSYPFSVFALIITLLERRNDIVDINRKAGSYGTGGSGQA